MYVILTNKSNAFVVRKKIGLTIGSQTIRDFCAGSSRRAHACRQGAGFRLEDLETE
jgi:hypothetical protein